jgi:hypothetical protein
MTGQQQTGEDVAWVMTVTAFEQHWGRAKSLSTGGKKEKQHVRG